MAVVCPVITELIVANMSQHENINAGANNVGFSPTRPTFLAPRLEKARGVRRRVNGVPFGGGHTP